MSKTVTLDYELDYDDICQVSFKNDSVKFSTMVDGGIRYVTLPIEVFYQMYQSDEMISHIEAYHERRKIEEPNQKLKDICNKVPIWEHESYGEMITV